MISISSWRSSREHNQGGASTREAAEGEQRAGREEQGEQGEAAGAERRALSRSHHERADDLGLTSPPLARRLRSVLDSSLPDETFFAAGSPSLVSLRI